MAKLTILILGERLFKKVLFPWKINRSIRIYTFLSMYQTKHGHLGDLVV